MFTHFISKKNDVDRANNIRKYREIHTMPSAEATAEAALYLRYCMLVILNSRQAA